MGNLIMYQGNSRIEQSSKGELDVGQTGLNSKTGNYPIGQHDGFDVIMNISEEDDPIDSIENIKRPRVLHTTSGLSGNKDSPDIISTDSASPAQWDSRAQ
ncbi:hypothetical protein V6N13_009485 [Hibiscus sabdariffa]